jgi:hypothetical protein
VVLSTFGAMFAPDQQKAAAELLRVCRSGGRIGMANWTPDSFVGRMFRTTTMHLTGGQPPPFDPPPLWGTEERLRELFGDGISELRTESVDFNFRFRSPQHFLAYFREYFGPVRVAVESLDQSAAEKLISDLSEVVAELDRNEGEQIVVPSEYLEVVAVRA